MNLFLLNTNKTSKKKLSRNITLSLSCSKEYEGLPKLPYVVC